MSDQPVCAECGGAAQSGRALCSPCASKLAEKAAAARRKREGR